METWDAIRARRNVRSYSSEPVPAADLDRIAEAGWRAPSASNRQHWDFIIVTDRQQLTDLSQVWQGAGHVAKAPAAMVLVVPEPADERIKVVDQYDLGPGWRQTARDTALRLLPPALMLRGGTSIARWTPPA